MFLDSPLFDLLSRGRAAAKAGEAAEARRYLERLLGMYPSLDERMEALYWLSEVSQDPKEQRDCLEEILANNLGDARARRKLAILDGKLKQDEIVDPDHVPPPPKGASQEAVARSFTCPKCGGKRVFAPDGQTLVCEYCENQERVQSEPSGGVGDDFLVALATGKAHRKPVSAHALTCRGCGSTFLLPAERITQICPYCGSPYGIEQIEVRELDAPDSIIPFSVDLQKVKLALRDWFQKYMPNERPRLTPGVGTYLPAWVFSMGGQINWTGRVYHNKIWVPVSGGRIVSEDNLLIPATKRLPPGLQGVFQQFDLSAVQPFDLRFLANWMAETFQIPAAEAALDARKQAIDRMSGLIKADEMDGSIDSFQMHTANMLVEAYRLVLLPVWMTTYVLDEKSYELIINGQTAAVLGQRPQKGLGGWLQSLLD
jgi:hypothetical protein